MPTRYTLVHDEIGFSADELQDLVHNLCYTFASLTRAVDIVPPVYYAYLACQHGQCYLRTLLKGITDRRRSTTNADADPSTEDTMREAEALWKGGVAWPLKETMFYL